MQQTLIQKILSKQGVNSEYIDSQNLISKLSLLELLQKYERYMCLDSSHSTKYFKRIEASLQFIPEKYQKVALTLFANVFYVGDSILSDALVYLFKEIAALNNDDENNVVKSMHIFEVDPSGLIESFFRVNKIVGRLDSDTFSRCKSVGEFITNLHNYISCEKLKKNDALISNIKGLLKKEIWILLTDFSFSGTSLNSEIDKLLKLRNICFHQKKKPKIIVCVQIISAKSLEEIESKFGNEIQILYAQLYNDRLRVIPERVWGSENKKLQPSLLFEQNNAVYLEAVELCNWFGSEYIDRDPDHEKTLKQGQGGTLAFGYKDCGFTVIPQRNAPSNSLPILWYTPSKTFQQKYNKNYIPPFPRTTSRVSQSTSGDKKHLEELEKNKKELRKSLSLLQKL
jgi:hypothetical protein